VKNRNRGTNLGEYFGKKFSATHRNTIKNITEPITIIRKVTGSIVDSRCWFRSHAITVTNIVSKPMNARVRRFNCESSCQLFEVRFFRLQNVYVPLSFLRISPITRTTTMTKNVTRALASNDIFGYRNVVMIRPSPAPISTKGSLRTRLCMVSTYSSDTLRLLRIWPVRLQFPSLSLLVSC